MGVGRREDIEFTNCRRCRVPWYEKYVSQRSGLCRRCKIERHLEHSVRSEAMRVEVREMPLPLLPTEAVPGTEEKIRVMADRISLGVSCFHPEDPHWYDEIESKPVILKPATLGLREAKPERFRWALC